MADSAPALSVIVSTRNRPDHAAGCARAILACSGPAFEAILVDQSEGEGTARLLAALGDPRVRYFRGTTVGLSAGRNEGIAEARAPLLAFTDDDCRPAQDWMERLVRCFATEPETAIVCGRVRGPQALAADEFVAVFEPEESVLSGRFPRLDRDFGIGANLAARRSALERLGPYDEALGAGSPFRSGEDTDLLLRALGAGLRVRNLVEAEVLHLGVRKGEAVRSLHLGYVSGGATCVVKNARAGNRAALRLWLRRLWSLSLIANGRLLRGQRPLGLRWLLAYLQGSLASFRFGVRSEPRLFVGWLRRRPVRAPRI